MKDTVVSATLDGRIKIGDLVTITLDWAHQLRRNVYDGRKTVEQLRVERTGRVLEIWIGGHDPHLWCSVRLGVAMDQWEQADDLELVA